MNAFIKMTKDGQTIEVNSLCLKDHQQLGWTVVPEPSVSAETQASAEDPAAADSTAEPKDDKSKGKGKS